MYTLRVNAVGSLPVVWLCVAVECNAQEIRKRSSTVSGVCLIVLLYTQNIECIKDVFRKLIQCMNASGNDN